MEGLNSLLGIDKSIFESWEEKIMKRIDKKRHSKTSNKFMPSLKKNGIKITAIAAVFLLLLVLIPYIKKLIGFSPKGSYETPEIVSEKSNYTAKDFFPMKSDLYKKFDGGFENGGEEKYVEFIKGNRIQIKNYNGGAIVSSVYEVSNDEVKCVYRSAGEDERVDYTDKNNEKPDVLIKGPIVKGTQWTDYNGNKRYISGVDVKVKTHAGEYNALEITTESPSNDGMYKSIDYYVKDLGFVKNVYISPKEEQLFETTLAKVEENKVYVQDIKVYYPEFLNERIVYKTYHLELKTNTDISKFFEECLKNSPKEGISAVMGKDAKINKITFDNVSRSVKVDLSPEFVTELNSGAALESMKLDSLANTFGSYYGSNKVYLTIDGKPYASGHIALKPEEFLEPKLDKAVELK